MKVLIGTKNPGKIEGAKQAIGKFYKDYTIEGIPVESDVSEQPIGEETLEGARNRVANLKKYTKENGIEADLYMAIESGMINQMGIWMNTSIAIIQDNKGKESVSMAAGYPIPDEYVDEIKNTNTQELMDRLFKTHKVGQGKGGIGCLTHGEISRIDLTREAFILALVKFINGEIWK